MAKRKRLSFDSLDLEGKSHLAGQLDPSLQVSPPSRAAPIAQVAGDSSAQAAIATLTAELEDARSSGRLLLRLDLDQIDEEHMSRDRLSADPQEMNDLISSIRDRGQQMPIEVTALGDGRFGLISGWRRLRALRHLFAETGDPAFGRVLALPRAPENMAASYRAMVEENEIRAGLSYYERARIAALAAEAGVYPDTRAAIAGLFAAASRAKRSKIGSFLGLWRVLDGRLRFASAISERLGLALARAIEDDPVFGSRLVDRLRKANPGSPEEEIALLERALSSGSRLEKANPAIDSDEKSSKQRSPSRYNVESKTSVKPARQREEIRAGINLDTEGDLGEMTLTLSGSNVDKQLREQLIAWLRHKA
jgi:ParB-like chromosome segregation protein Spo0J